MQATVIVLRLIHVIAGVLWLGGVALLTIFIIPSVQATGDAGSQMTQHLVRRTKLGVYLPSVGGLSVLSGLTLYWHDATVAVGNFGGSRQGIAYAIGGLSAIVALIVGGAMAGRSASALGKLGEAVEAQGGRVSSEQEQTFRVLNRRLDVGSRIAVIALFLTASLMAVGRYL